MPTQDVAVFFGEHEINQIKATVGNAELGSGSGCRLREFKPKCCDKIPAEDEEFAENHQKLASIIQGYPTM